MSEGLFDIFGDRFSKTAQNITRQPLSNNENIGKSVKNGPTTIVKPCEPVKKAGEVKKSFLSNTGAALRDLQTPQTPLTPRSRNLEASAKKMFSSQLIFNDVTNKEDFSREELRFTRPRYKYDNRCMDAMDFLFEEPKLQSNMFSPQTTPPNKTFSHNLEADDSYDDDFFKDDLADNGFPAPFEDDDLPEI